MINRSVIFGAIIATVMPITANAARDNYAGIRLHKNQNAAFDYDIRGGTNFNMKNDHLGFGAFIGNKLTDHVRVEFETAYMGAKFDKYGTDLDFDTWSNMFNVYLFQEYEYAVAPYVGVGIGFTGIWADIDGATPHSSDSAFELSYQIMAGVNFALNDRVDLNIGIKYQNYGRIDHKGPNGTFADTSIDATEIYFSAAYKFDIR